MKDANFRNKNGHPSFMGSHISVCSSAFRRSRTAWRRNCKLKSVNHLSGKMKDAQIQFTFWLTCNCHQCISIDVNWILKFGFWMFSRSKSLIAEKPGFSPQGSVSMLVPRHLPRWKTSGTSLSGNAAPFEKLDFLALSDLLMLGYPLSVPSTGRADKSVNWFFWRMPILSNFHMPISSFIFRLYGCLKKIFFSQSL